MLKFIVVIAISITAYGSGSGTGAGTSVNTTTIELPFETYEACIQHAEGLKTIHYESNRVVTVSCSEAGKW